MNSGSFFRLDIENSKVFEGVTFYEYIDLPDLAAGEDNIRYPFRMSISQDRVSFFVHYFDDSGNYLLRHTEEVILDLPYNTTNPEALSSTIKRIYNTVFPISDYLQRIMGRRYDSKLMEELLEQEKKTQDKKEIEKIEKEIEIVSKYKYLTESQINKDSYSSLYIWDLIDNPNSNNSSYQLQNSKKKFSRFLRKLLLDFMFDLMHSDVFESSKCYSQVREGLMKDFFFSSIVKKCEFYYCRRLIKSRFNSFETGKVSFDDYLKKLYAEKLDVAESTWIDTIMSPMAEKHFSFSPEWYEDQKPAKKNDGTFCVSDSWFVNLEEEMSRVVFPLPEPTINNKQSWWQKFLDPIRLCFDDSKSTIHYLNSFELSNLVGSPDNTSVLERNKKISKWFYRRFDFKDAFRLHFFHGWNDVFCFSLLLSSVLLISFPFLWSSPQYIAIIPFALSLASLFISIGFRVNINRHSKLQEQGLDDILVCLRRKRECRKALKLCAFFLCVGAFLCSFESSVFDSYRWIVIIVFLICLVGLFLLLFKEKSRSGDFVHLFLPRLVASITAAWVMLIIGNDLINEHMSIPACLIISIIVFVFIRYEIDKTIPNITKKGVLLRSFELMLISFSIALIVGTLAIDVQSPALLADKNNVNFETWHFISKGNGYKLQIYPEYLIRFSALAMFIGVFIQMIFEEKKITEM